MFYHCCNKNDVRQHCCYYFFTATQFNWPIFPELLQFRPGPHEHLWSNFYRLDALPGTQLTAPVIDIFMFSCKQYTMLNYLLHCCTVYIDTDSNTLSCGFHLLVLHVITARSVSAISASTLFVECHEGQNHPSELQKFNQRSLRHCWQTQMILETVSYTGSKQVCTCPFMFGQIT